jgi:hypothetical protein
MQVRLGRGAGAIRVDHRQLGAAPLARPGDVAHDVDLGRDRVAAPHHDQVGLGDLARVDAAFHPDAGEPSGIGQRVAYGAVLARVALDVAQPLDAVALHQAHGAGIEVGPHRLRRVALLGPGQALGHRVEGIVPGDRPERLVPAALVADPAQRRRQPVRVVYPLGIAGDLGAHHADGVAVGRGAAHPADGVRIEPLDLERAGARTVVRTHRRQDLDGGVQGHG